MTKGPLAQQMENKSAVSSVQHDAGCTTVKRKGLGQMSADLFWTSID